MATAFLARASVALLGGPRSPDYRKSAFVQRTKAILPYCRKVGVVPFPVVHRRSSFIRATNEVSESGSVDSTLIQNMKKKVRPLLNLPQNVTSFIPHFKKKKNYYFLFPIFYLEKVEGGYFHRKVGPLPAKLPQKFEVLWETYFLTFNPLS